MHNRLMNPSDAITLLVASGMTEQAIAAELNVNQTTVNRIRRRAVTPSFKTGQALIDLATSRAAPKKRATRRAA